jgi:long-chain acyl-CoA synthetase
MPNLAASLAAFEDEPQRLIAIEFVQGIAAKWQAAQFAHLAARWQVAFEQAGLKAGDRVAISARNSVQWLAIDQAALGLGIVTVALDPQTSARFAAAAIAHSGADLLLIDSASRANQILQAGPPIERVVMLRVLQHGRSRLTSVEDFLPQEPSCAFRAVDLNEDYLATICYQRNGKDGLRGVTLSHANLLASVHAQNVAGLVAHGQRVLACGTLSELFHRVSAYYLALACGAVIALPETGANLHKALGDILPEVLTIRGDQLQRLADLLREPLRASGNAIASLDTALEAGMRSTQGNAKWWDKLLFNAQAERLKQTAQSATGGQLQRVLCAQAQPIQAMRQISTQGLQLTNGLSLAVSAGLASMNPLQDAQAHTCGPCLPGVEAMLSPQGELLLRGLTLSQGYWNDPAATQADFQPEGWVHTGHRATLCAGHIIINGFLREPSPQDTQQVPLAGDALITDSTTSS